MHMFISLNNYIQYYTLVWLVVLLIIFIGWIDVTWDHGPSNSYRMGAEGKYDLKISPSESEGAATALPPSGISRISHAIPLSAATATCNLPSAMNCLQLVSPSLSQNTEITSGNQRFAKVIIIIIIIVIVFAAHLIKW